jgi:hypothetical protein
MRIHSFSLLRQLLCRSTPLFLWINLFVVYQSIRPNKKIGVVPVTRPTHWGDRLKFFTPSKNYPRIQFFHLKCNNMTPNAVKMHIREV